MGAFIIQLNTKKTLVLGLREYLAGLASYLTDRGTVDQMQTGQENAEISLLGVGKGLKLTMLSFPWGQHVKTSVYPLLCSDLQSLLSTWETTNFSDLFIHSLTCKYLTYFIYRNIIVST